MSKCRSCGQEVSWVKMPSGKSMPVNNEEIVITPNLAGDKTIVTVEGRVVKGFQVGDAFEDGVQEIGSISHFATCPNAADHRRN